MSPDMSRFYDVANFLVWHPERAWSIAAIFFVFFIVSLVGGRYMVREGRGWQSWPLLMPAIGWAVFGLLELSCKIAKANIRIDLFITWPTILGLTAVFSIWWGVSLLIGLGRFYSRTGWE
jgi:hypothetical protein